MQRYWPRRAEEKTKSPEDEMRETEMCDVCGRSYNYTYIKRFDYFSKRGIHYVVRCCPYCNISMITQKLI